MQDFRPFVQYSHCPEPLRDIRTLISSWPSTFCIPLPFLLRSSCFMNDSSFHEIFLFREVFISITKNCTENTLWTWLLFPLQLPYPHPHSKHLSELVICNHFIVFTHSFFYTILPLYQIPHILVEAALLKTTPEHFLSLFLLVHSCSTYQLWVGT